MKLDPHQKDVITELFNIGVGRAADALNKLVGRAAKLEVPSVDILGVEEAIARLNIPKGVVLSHVGQKFKCVFSGEASVIFPKEDSKKIAELITGISPDDPQFERVHEETVKEIGNILTNAILGTVSNMLDQLMDYTVPVYKEDEFHNLVKSEITEEDPTQSVIILCKTRFRVETLNVEGFFMMFINVKAIHSLLVAIEAKTKIG